MTVLLSEAALASRVRLARLRIEQYHRMLETGILQDGDPIELLDGLLVYKDRSAREEDPMSIGKKHGLVILLLAGLATRFESLGCLIQTHGPLDLSPFHEPEPDAVILRGCPRDYANRLPGAGDAFCVFEVADSSIAHDRTAKLRIYASAGVPQYVIVNLVDCQVEVWEDPVAAEGRYDRSAILRPEDTLVIHLGANGRIEVAAREILP